MLIVNKLIFFCIGFVFTVISFQFPLLAQNRKEEEFGLVNQVTKIELSGNTVFSDLELLEQITPLIEKKATLERLNQIKREITDYYVGKGYIATGAFIPPQKIVDGKIKIVIVEGKLSEVIFSQEDIVNKKYIENRLPNFNEVINYSSLVSALGTLQNSPFIKSINGDISYNNQGEIILTLDVVENSRISKEFSFSNTFSPSIGEFGGQAKLNFNAMGVGDVLEIGATRTKGLEQIFGVYYLPLSKHDFQLVIEYISASSNLVLDDLEELDIRGEFDSYSLGLNHPIKLSSNQQLNFKIALNIEHSESFILEDFSFSFIDEFEDRDGTIRISELSLTQQYKNISLNTSFVLSSSFNVGMDIFNPTISRSARDGRYWSWDFEGQGVVKLNSNINWFSSIKLQLSPDNLLPSKQFALGGVSSVRGYSQNLILGNSGISAINELQTSVYKTGDSDLRVIAFIDAGKSWANSVSDAGRYLVSSGLGFQYTKDELLNVRLDYAVPLSNADDLESRSESASNIIFSIQLAQ